MVNVVCDGLLVRRKILRLYKKSMPICIHQDMLSAGAFPPCRDAKSCVSRFICMLYIGILW